MNKRIYLTGIPGAGKRETGRLLAKRRGVDFVDISGDIEYAQKRSVSEIVLEDGEKALRKMEYTMLLCAGAAVVAVDAAAMAVPESLRWMKEKGSIVFLAAAPSVIARRPDRAAGAEQPLAVRLRRIKKLLFYQAYIYNEADYVLDVTCLSPHEGAAALEKMFYET